MAKKQTKASLLEAINKKYFIPASKELKKGIESGVLPKNCVVLWANNSTIEMVGYAKKV